MSAPGSVVLNEDVIVVIGDDLLEVLSNNDLNRLIVVSGDILTLKEGGESAGLEVLNELLDGVNSDALGLTVEGEFLHVVGGVKDSDGGEVALFNTNEFTESLLDAISDT